MAKYWSITSLSFFEEKKNSNVINFTIFIYFLYLLCICFFLDIISYFLIYYFTFFIIYCSIIYLLSYYLISYSFFSYCLFINISDFFISFVYYLLFIVYCLFYFSKCKFCRVLDTPSLLSSNLSKTNRVDHFDTDTFSNFWSCALTSGVCLSFSLSSRLVSFESSLSGSKTSADTVFSTTTVGSWVSISVLS